MGSKCSCFDSSFGGSLCGLLHWYFQSYYYIKHRAFLMIFCPLFNDGSRRCFVSSHRSVGSCFFDCLLFDSASAVRDWISKKYERSLKGKGRTWISQRCTRYHIHWFMMKWLTNTYSLDDVSFEGFFTCGFYV